jgi:hypothetical protein
VKHKASLYGHNGSHIAPGELVLQGRQHVITNVAELLVVKAFVVLRCYVNEIKTDTTLNTPAAIRSGICRLFNRTLSSLSNIA